jgi:hypothetical protein
MAGPVHFRFQELYMSLSAWIAIAVTAAILAAFRWGRTWLCYRGDRVVTCPENRRPAGVHIDAVHAAASSLGGAPKLRLFNCSRWPEKAGCGQQCLCEIQAAPEDCLVRNIAADWYDGRVCAGCGQPIRLEWGPAQPALLSGRNIILEWRQVPADQLTETLEASAPLCFACYLANTLVRDHPELAIDRHRPQV